MNENATSEASAPQSQSVMTESTSSIQRSQHSASTYSDTHLDYEPIPLRWPTLSALLFIICGLLALLEYAHKLVPAIKDPGATQIPNVIELHPRMTLVASDAKPVVIATPTADVSDGGVTLSTRRPVSYPIITPRQYPLENGTELPTINGTGFATNSSQPSPSPGHQACKGTRDLRSSCDQNPANYASRTWGPFVYASFRCPWENGPPGHNPVWPSQHRSFDDACKFVYENCNLPGRPEEGVVSLFVEWYDSETDSDCKVQLFNQGPNQTPYHQEMDLDSTDWVLIVDDANSWRCFDAERSTAIRCISMCPDFRQYECYDGPESAAVTQVFRVLESATSTSQIAGFETVVTSIITKKDGDPTTLVQTTSVSGSVSTITTNVATVLVTATGLAGRNFWTQISKTTIVDGSGPLPPDFTNHPTTVILRNQLGIPTATNKEYLETLVDSNGLPTATLTMGLETLTDSRGLPTNTLAEFTATGTDSLSTFPSTSPYIITPNRPDAMKYIYVGRSEYFIGSFLPVLLSVLLCTLVQLVDKNLKTMLPFYALTRPNGATAEDSLCMIPGGLVYLPRSFRLFYCRMEPLSFLSDLLVILSSLLVSVSSEAIEVRTFGICLPDNGFGGCYLSLVLLDGPFRAGETLMITMAIVVVLIWTFRIRARSGVTSNPWSIAASCSLLSHKVGNLLSSVPRDDEGYIKDSQVLRVLEGKSFALQYYQGSQGTMRYGIAILQNKTSCEPIKSSQKVKKITCTSSSARSKRTRKRFVSCFKERIVRDYGVHSTLLVILCGLLIVIIYYETKQMDPLVNSFERFMDSQKFGVRFLFSASGVVIALFWDSIFSRKYLLTCFKNILPSLLPPYRNHNSKLIL